VLKASTTDRELLIVRIWLCSRSLNTCGYLLNHEQLRLFGSTMISDLCLQEDVRQSDWYQDIQLSETVANPPTVHFIRYLDSMGVCLLLGHQPNLHFELATIRRSGSSWTVGLAGGDSYHHWQIDHCRGRHRQWLRGCM
jgi:hypothetical protein